MTRFFRLADTVHEAALPGDTSSIVVQLSLIGHMEAWTQARESVLPLGRKTRALFAIVALSAPRPVVRSRLAELLWSRRHEEQARASLRQEIHRLLDALQMVGTDILAVTRDNVALKPGVVWVDVDQVMNATAADPSALSLLTGKLLDEFDGIDPAFDIWLAAERERLQDRARTVAEALLRRQVEPETTITVAQQLLGIDRAHEGAWRALMQAYAARGERGMAVQAYERCRAVLKDQLDATPSPETQRLLAAIRAGTNAATNATTNATSGRAESRTAEVALPESRRGARTGVLPLQMIGTGPDEAHLSLSLAEEITAGLARFRSMFLVSSSSLQHFGNRDEATLQRVFGLDFLVDGGVQRVGARLRVTVRLVDLCEGNQIVWAHRFDRPMSDLLSLQDDIAAEVVAQIEPEVQRIEGQRATARAGVDPAAYDLLMRAVPLSNRLEKDEFFVAGDLLKQALALEPDYAIAHARLAFWLVLLLSQGWADDWESVRERAGRHAERAIVLDPQDSRALMIAGHVRAYLFRQPSEGLGLHDRALSLNPNLAPAWGLSALACTYLGDLEEATRRFARYRQLAPMDCPGYFCDTGMTMLEVVRRDYAGAVQIGRRSSQMNQGFAAGLRHYLSALGHAGLYDEAKVILRRLLDVVPDFTIQQYLAQCPLIQPADIEHYVAGLRLAGAPEGILVHESGVPVIA
jgi:DNA-binding SARP family transcriptional activator